MLLHELLAFDVLRDAGLRTVVPGDLDRPVRWLHTGEISDISRYLRGGEVLLTAATGVGVTQAHRRQYVRELAAVGAVALIVELGRAFTELPAEMIEEARARGLVVAELRQEVPFVEVTRRIHGAILNEHHEAQDRAIEIGDDFARRALDGTSLAVLLESLAQMIGSPVVLEDGSRHVVALGTNGQPVVAVLRDWTLHSRQGHQGGDIGVNRAASQPDCVWTSIVLRGEAWGRLHVLEMEGSLDPVAELALGRIASNLALLLMAERDARLSEAAERSLVTELARGQQLGSDEFAVRAAALGADLPNQLVALVVGAGPDGAGAAVEVSEQRIREGLRAVGWPGLVGMLGSAVVAVVSAEPARGLRSTVTALLDALGHPPGWRIGVGRAAPTALLHRSTSEAQAAHELGPTVEADAIHYYEQLTLHRLLNAIARAGPELANFVEAELGPLIRHDSEHRSDLLATLDTYLRSNGNKATTAQRLYLQRRSVYYRLARIEEILGRPIASVDIRTRLYLALRANELLGLRALSRHP